MNVSNLDVVKNDQKKSREVEKRKMKNAGSKTQHCIFNVFLYATYSRQKELIVEPTKFLSQQNDNFKYNLFV